MPFDLPGLVDRARRGEPRAVGRLLTLVESGDATRLRAVAAVLAPHTGHAHIVGVTGPPGVGKSTSTSALITALRARGDRVGVLAVDPSSTFSGGALLGDRIRMAEHGTDEGVFIRSMAARGRLGGLSWATPAALRVLDAAGCDVVVVETVGVGQSEMEVVALADTTVVLLAPGMGDGVQAAKAGILEVADVLVVNKADRDGAEQTARDLRHMTTLGERRGWRPPVLTTVAVRGEGMDAVVAALDEHRAWAGGSGERARRRAGRAAAEIEAVALDRLRVRVRAGAAEQVARAAGAGSEALDPYTAADEIVAALTGSRPSGV